MKKLIIAVATTALLGSCGVYTKYQRPELPLAELYPEELRQQSDSLHLGSLTWQSIFTDPQLQKLITQGLKENLDLRTAQLRIKQAEAGLSSARLAYLPTLALTPSATLSKVESQPSSRSYSLTAAASWQLDLFGSLTNAKRRAKALVEASEAYRQAVETQVVASIARSYYSLVLLDEQIKLSEETVRLWGENVRVMKAMMHAGQYNDAAVASAEANFAQIKASVLQLRQKRLEAENALSILLGASTHDKTRNSLESWKTPPTLRVGLPLTLLAQRPDLKRAETNLKAAFYATNGARSAFYPNITLTGNGGWTNSLGGLISNPAQLLLGAVASLTQPIFQGGKLRAQYIIAKSQQEEAYLSFIQTLLSAGAEVNNLYSQVQSLGQQSLLYQEQSTALKRAAHANRLLMETGKASYLEVLTAEQQLLQAQLMVLSNRFEEINATISLFQALGGGQDASLPSPTR